jgi:hypothetical protein
MFELLGLAAAACGFAGCILLLAFLISGADNPPGWTWLHHATGVSDDGAALIVFGTPLALCLLGLVMGSAGWMAARRSGTRTRAAKLSVALGLVGPVVLVASWVVMYLVFLLTASPLRPPG